MEFKKLNNVYEVGEIVFGWDISRDSSTVKPHISEIIIEQIKSINLIIEFSDNTNLDYDFKDFKKLIIQEENFTQQFKECGKSIIQEWKKQLPHFDMQTHENTVPMVCIKYQLEGYGCKCEKNKNQHLNLKHLVFSSETKFNESETQKHILLTFPKCLGEKLYSKITKIYLFQKNSLRQEIDTNINLMETKGKNSPIIIGENKFESSFNSNNQPDSNNQKEDESTVTVKEQSKLSKILKHIFDHAIWYIGGSIILLLFKTYFLH